MKTILLVEDDILSAKLMQIILTRLGNHQVIVTEDVNEILSLSRSNSVDLIIMDISLSNSKFEGNLLNGLVLTRMVKSDPHSKHIPIILASAHFMEEHGHKVVRESGADDFISKPLVDHQILIQKVNHWTGIQP